MELKQFEVSDECIGCRACVDGDKLIEKVSDYFNILLEEGIVDTKIDSSFLDIFKI